MDKMTEALVKLLFDEDSHVAVGAMEQLLKNEEALHEIFQIYQDSIDSNVRKRIHQLSSVYSRRVKKQRFLSEMYDDKVPLINSLIQLTVLTETKLNELNLRQKYLKLRDKFHKTLDGKAATSEKIVSFMRSNNFFMPETYAIETELLLFDLVLEYKLGSSLVLAALAYSLGIDSGWHGVIIIHEGEFSLLDLDRNIINPNYSWKVSSSENVGFYTCKKGEVIHSLICQLFLAALQDGNVAEINLFSSLMAECTNLKISDFPYPLGEERAEDLPSNNFIK
ncbi:MAG: hypothetical protein ACRC37_00120 [Lentisphaeria bacterium]